MGTDFFDDDLVKSADGENAEEGSKGFISLSPSSDTDRRMMQQRERLVEQVADTTEEIERMRMRQEELEHEKNKIEEIARMQGEYTSCKKEIIGNLTKSIVLMEKDEIQANRMVELLGSTRLRFKNMLSEIRDIKEDTWNDGVFEEELSKYLALIEDARMEYNKAVAKIDAESWQRGAEGKAKLRSLDGSMRASLADKGFLFWIKVGFAVSLPILLLLMGLFTAYLFTMGRL